MGNSDVVVRKVIPTDHCDGDGCCARIATDNTQTVCILDAAHHAETVGPGVEGHSRTPAVSKR